MGLDVQRQVLDPDQLVRRFYSSFKAERAIFQAFIHGLSTETDRQTYSLLMLNRLIFLYFMQKQGFLDSDTNYLPKRLRMIQEQYGKQTRTFFYRHFLLPLFHQKLGTDAYQQIANLDTLLGDIPTLHCSLFNIHELERSNPDIHIADEAFARLFAFFDTYQWHLDERPPSTSNKITPTILGYIFEQYVNQQQLGAYYTKEDITEYITRNTIIPFIFTAVEKICPSAFRPTSDTWQLLQEDPDRYIFASARHSNRLPTETASEYAARRTRYSEIKNRLLSGKVTSIQGLVTYNLDVRRFALDVIEHCEEPDLLQAFYSSIQHITILDPTCGSGAFLLAALDVLEPLYEAFLGRMRASLGVIMNFNDQHRTCHAEPFAAPSLRSGLWLTQGKLREAALGPSRETLRCAQDDKTFPILLGKTHNHAPTEAFDLHTSNSRYCILRSIITNNLYGVDIMQEAVEICKLRLFLKLIAQIDRVEDFEPLPDLNFHIRSGNALVGFVSREDVQEASLTSAKSATIPLSTNGTLSDDADDHEPLSQSEDLTCARLDRSLARKYDIDPDNAVAFEQWRQNHQPFHWYAEFNKVIGNGGFDVIIGNPPYVEYSRVRQHYTLPQEMYATETCGNLYALCMERFVALSNPSSTTGLIVPLSIVSTSRMAPLRQILYSAYSYLWLNNYDTIPGTLFSGIVQRNTIVLAAKDAGKAGCRIYTTRNQKWLAAERSCLFDMVPYMHIHLQSIDDLIPKVSTSIELSILTRIQAQKIAITDYTERHSKNTLVYKRRWSYFLLFADDIQGIVLPDGSTRQQQDVKTLALQPHIDRYVFIALLSSGLFYFHYGVFSDFRHVNRADFAAFRFDYARLAGNVAYALSKLGKTLMQSYLDNLEWRRCNYAGSIGECLVPFYRQGASKPIIDEIDHMLAQHYGLTEEELDFIANYEIKYRLGQKH